MRADCYIHNSFAMKNNYFPLYIHNNHCNIYFPSYQVLQNKVSMNSSIISINVKKLIKSCDCDRVGIECNAKRFKQNFKNWTSGNKRIDRIIQNNQLSAHYHADKVIEWISYDRFFDIKYSSSDKVYKANWIDGRIDKWDNKDQNWKRKDQNMFVILKNLNSSIKIKNITLKSLNKVINNLLFTEILFDIKL
jgi:hypothetical protein